MSKEKEKRICEQCGEEIHGEVKKFDGKTLCEYCFDAETVVCQHCGTRIWRVDNAGSSDFPLCPDCFDDHYTNCERCGCVLHEDYTNYICGEPYCDSCYDVVREHSIHTYSYKPDPIFYGAGKRFFGVELEIDGGGTDEGNAEILLDIGNVGDEKVYIKNDGSLNDGMEIVTHPMSLEFHKTKMPWKEIMEEAVNLGYKSHKTSTCGLHIHVGRNTFGDTRETQDDAISRVLYFVEHHWNELLKFSRRTEKQMAQWAARYGYKNDPKEILDHAKNNGDNRYTCVNITNWNTVEFRMFRGTLKYNTLIATLELVNKICTIAVNCDDKNLAKLSWTDFVTSLNESDCAELITYLKERRLYVNAPISGKEDE